MRFEQYSSVEKHWRKENENSNKILVLTGLSGSGKDYLIKKMMESGRLSTDVSTYSFGEKLFEVIKKQFPELKDKDQIRSKLTPYDLVAGINSAVEQILQEQPVLLNTHTVAQQSGGLFITPGFDRKIKAGSYVYVWTDPEQIYRWRRSDLTRNRSQESVEEIAVNQSIALVVTAKIAQLNEAAFHTLENRSNDLQTNIDLLSNYLEEIGM